MLEVAGVDVNACLSRENGVLFVHWEQYEGDGSLCVACPNPSVAGALTKQLFPGLVAGTSDGAPKRLNRLFADSSDQISALPWQATCHGLPHSQAWRSRGEGRCVSCASALMSTMELRRRFVCVWQFVE